MLYEPEEEIQIRRKRPRGRAQEGTRREGEERWKILLIGYAFELRFPVELEEQNPSTKHGITIFMKLILISGQQTEPFFRCRRTATTESETSSFLRHLFVH